MRQCLGVPGVRREVLLTWVVWLCVTASPGWAAPLFGRPGDYMVDGSPIGIVDAALDEQAGRDLVTANEAGSEGPSLSILGNRGQGSFFPERRVTVSATQYILQGVASGDFNVDGRDDVAVIVDDISELPIRASVLVYLTRANGTLPAEPAEYRLSGFFPRAIAVGELTGDDAPDLAVAYAQTAGGGGLVSVLAGQRNASGPTGRFAAAGTTVVGTAPSAITLGDIDADGQLDALVTDRDGGSVFALYGSGNPAAPLGAPVELLTVTAPVTALVHEVPGRALPQVLVGRQSGHLLTLAQTAARVFDEPVQERLVLQLTAMGLAALDDDELDDLVVLSANGAELWIGEADGGFRLGESIIPRDTTLDALTLADFNDDDRIDVAASASTQDRVTVVLNGADAPFTPSPTPSVTETPVVTATPTSGPVRCAGDCDGNGQVSINELIRGVNIALGSAALDDCAVFDVDGNGQVAVNELIAAVNAALAGCPA